MKSLLLLFSALFLIGCSSKEIKIETYFAGTEIVYPKYDTNSTIKITAKKVDGNITMSEGNFTALVKEAKKMKIHIEMLQDIIDKHNAYVRDTDKIE